MLLHTPLYLIFLFIVAILYWILPKYTWRKYFLLIASYVFYVFIDWRFLLVLLIITGITFLLGHVIQGSPRAKIYALLSVGVNLGALGVFLNI